MTVSPIPTPPGTIHFQSGWSRPVLHWRKRKDYLNPNLPAEHESRPCLLGLYKPKPDLRSIITQAQDDWTRRKKRCPVCRRRIHRVEIPMFLIPQHPWHEWYKRELNRVQETLGQLTTFDKAVHELNRAPEPIGSL